jgi:hypothetical protein
MAGGRDTRSLDRCAPVHISRRLLHGLALGLGYEWVAGPDAFVFLAGVEVFGVQDLAAEFLRAAQDQRIPEGRAGLLVDADGGSGGYALPK